MPARRPAPGTPRSLLGAPLVLADNARAVVGRPWRHRRRPELEQTAVAPPGAWWAADDRWYPADAPPRRGNRLLPLVDGEAAMATMYAAMEGARSSILIASWFLTPNLRMVRTPDDLYDPPEGRGGPYAFLPLLARTAPEVDIRVLMWPGSQLGKFARKHVEQMRRDLVAVNPRIQAYLDTHEHFSHCQHQKTLIVDGRIAFVGGIDVTAFDADRWDVPAHTFREGRNWHDVNWQIEGPCVFDVAVNFAQRWDAVVPHNPVPVSLLVPPDPAPATVRTDILAAGVGTAGPNTEAVGGEAAPRPATETPPETPATDIGRADDESGIAQVQRTIPRGVYSWAPRGIFGIAHAYRRALARAERFIYLENQYLWSPEITAELCDAIDRGASSGLRVAVVLPSHPNVGKSDTDRHIEELVKADAGRGIFQAYALYTSRRVPAGTDAGRYEYRPIYVHAKIAVIDDAWATVGSANLNGRGMVSDSEINISTTDRASIRALRLSLWSEHLGCQPEDLRDLDPAGVLGGRWRNTAMAQQRIAQARSGPLTAAVYPYTAGRVDADFGPGEIESALLDL